MSSSEGRSAALIAEDCRVHNSTVEESFAQAGTCGQVHLASGRVCTLAQRHPGGCDFAPRPEADARVHARS